MYVYLTRVFVSIPDTKEAGLLFSRAKEMSSSGQLEDDDRPDDMPGRSDGSLAVWPSYCFIIIISFFYTCLILTQLQTTTNSLSVLPLYFLQKWQTCCLCVSLPSLPSGLHHGRVHGEPSEAEGPGEPRRLLRPHLQLHLQAGLGLFHLQSHQNQMVGWPTSVTCRDVLQQIHV